MIQVVHEPDEKGVWRVASASWIFDKGGFVIDEGKENNKIEAMAATSRLIKNNFTLFLKSISDDIKNVDERTSEQLSKVCESPFENEQEVLDLIRYAAEQDKNYKKVGELVKTIYNSHRYRFE